VAAPSWNQNGPTGGSFLASASVPTPHAASGIAAGDIAILQITCSATASGQSVSSWASGFTPIAGAEQTTDHHSFTAWRRCDGSENGGTATTTLSISDDGSSRIVYYRDAIGVGTPYEGLNSGKGTSTTVTSPSITTAGSDRLCVHLVAYRRNSATSPPATWTEDIDAGANTARVVSEHKTRASAGTEASTSRSITSADWICDSLALLPVPTPIVETPTAAAVALSAPAPALALALALAPSAAAATCSAPAPALALSIDLAPSAAAAVASAPAPQLDFGTVLAPSAASASLSAPAAVLALALALAPAAAAASISAPAPALALEVLLQPFAAALALALPDCELDLSVTDAPPTSYPALPATTFVVELQPGYNGGTVPNRYRIRNMATGGFFTTDTRYGGPLDDKALADAIRRSGPGNRIDIAPGCDLDFVSIGDTDTGKTYCAYWGPHTGPFARIHDLYIVGVDPLARARIRRFGASRFVRDNMAVTHDQGPLDALRFYRCDFHNPGGTTYCWSTPLGDQEVNGLFGFYDCECSGAKNYGSLYDTKTCIRAGYARWEILELIGGECEEHVIYVDAPQGGFWARGVRNVTYAAAPAVPRTGRTCIQLVQRAIADGGPIYGGPPGFGNSRMEDCTADGCCENGASAFTVAGFLGTVDFIRLRSINSHGGGIVVWGDWGKGLHTTLGEFDSAPWPLSRTAFHTGAVAIEDFYFRAASPWTQPRDVIALAGASSVVLRGHDVDGSRAAIGCFSFAPGGGMNSGPLDCGTLEFDVAVYGATPHTWPGFGATGGKVRYGYTANPAQTGSGNGLLTNAQIDALAGPNAAYPPWSQALAGIVVSDAPAVALLEAPAATVGSSAVILLQPSAAAAATSAPAPALALALALSPERAAATAKAPKVVAAVGTPIVLSPASAAASAAAPDPALALAMLPAAGKARAKLVDPALVLGQILSPSAAAASPSAPAAGVSLALDLAPAAASAAASAPAAALALRLDPGAAQAVLAAPDPLVTSNVVLQPSAAQASAQAPAAALALDLALQPAAAAVSTSAPIAAAGSFLDLSPAAAQVSASAPAPALALALALSPGAAAAAAQAPAAALVLEIALSPGPAALSASAAAPALDLSWLLAPAAAQAHAAAPQVAVLGVEPPEFLLQLPLVVAGSLALPAVVLDALALELPMRDPLRLALGMSDG